MRERDAARAERDSARSERDEALTQLAALNAAVNGSDAHSLSGEVLQRLVNIETKIDKLRVHLPKEAEFKPGEGRLPKGPIELQAWFEAKLRDRFRYLGNEELAKARIAALNALLLPHRAEGFPKIRIGNTNDGGYVCIDDFRDIDAAISLGIGDDVSWDLDIAERSIPVYQYDHTISGPPVPRRRFHFKRQRVGARGMGGRTIEAIVAEAQIRKPGSAIMKIDIEHDEWEALGETPEDTLSLFTQIMGEFHGFDEVLDDNWFFRSIQLFEKLHRHFRLVHVHGNNCTSQLVLGQMLFPRSLELTFANMLRYRLVRSNEAFPGVLDAPCNPSFPDYGLGRFVYEFDGN